MLIAQEKRKENIIEYLLYMYQVEDTIRACGFDISLIEQRIIDQFKVSDKLKTEVKNWYADLIVMMHQEKIKDNGHLKMLETLVDDLNKLHLWLLEKKKDKKYIEQYLIALPNIQAFNSKLNKKSRNEIDSCVTGLYALLLLRLQKKGVSEGTLEAMQTFSNLLASLAVWYKTIDERASNL